MAKSAKLTLNEPPPPWRDKTFNCRSVSQILRALFVSAVLVAADGDGVDSPFPVAVARDVKEPHVEVRKLFDIVRDDVWTATKHEQQPFIYGSPPGREDFYFVAGK